jgi:hypothetical protein
MRQQKIQEKTKKTKHQPNHPIAQSQRKGSKQARKEASKQATQETNQPFLGKDPGCEQRKCHCFLLLFVCLFGCCLFTYHDATTCSCW